MKSIMLMLKGKKTEQIDINGAMILCNPDGSYLELEPIETYQQSKLKEEEDQAIEIRQRAELEQNHDEQYLINDLDDDLIRSQFIPTLIESVLDMLMRQQCNIICIVFLHLILNIGFTLMAIYFREETIKKLVFLFQDDYDRAYTLYYALFTLDMIACSIFYALAFTAYCKKSIGLYQMLMKWIYFCFFVQVLLAYINKLNLLLVFLKVLTYVYAKFIASLIKGLVTLPRQRMD